MRGGHPGEGWGHLRPEGDVAVALVGEVVKLADDFVAAFFRVQVEFLDGRAVVFAEAVSLGGAAPGVEDVAA